MFNSVQYVRDICKERKIAISLLEKDCGFANGYLNPKKMAKIPYDRAILIADYLGIPAEDILSGPGNKKAPTADGERSVSHDEIKFALFRGREDITDAMYQEVLNFAEYVARREDEKKKKE